MRCKNATQKLLNVRKVLEFLRRHERFNSRHLFDADKVIRGDKQTILELLKDIHDFYRKSEYQFYPKTNLVSAKIFVTNTIKPESFDANYEDRLQCERINRTGIKPGISVTFNDPDKKLKGILKKPRETVDVFSRETTSANKSWNSNVNFFGSCSSDIFNSRYEKSKYSEPVSKIKDWLKSLGVSFSNLENLNFEKETMEEFKDG